MEIKDSRRKWNAWALSSLAGALVLLHSACRSLPETGVNTFAEATKTLKITVTTVGKTAVQDVAQIHGASEDSKANATQLSNELKAAWDKRLAVVDALDSYSSALARLVSAGKAGQENAAAFGDSLKGLISAAGASVPASPAANAIIEVAQRAYGEVARHLAAKEIHKAVEAADPAISSLSGLISEDLLNLRSIAVEKRRTALTKLRAGNDAVRQINSLTEARNDAVTAALNPNSAPADSVNNLRRINETHAAITSSPDYMTLKQNETAIEQLFRAQTDLLDQASATVISWGASHHELVASLREKRAPSLDDLRRYATDLYDIYRDYRKARTQL